MKNIITILILPMWIIYFLSKFIPRDKTLIVFGTHTNSFSGNIKSLFLTEEDSKYKKVFISDNKKLVALLNTQGYEAYTKLSLQAIWHSLRAGTYIYSGFPSDINFWLSSGVKYINVWHGTPIKKIERDVTTGKYSLKNKYTWIFKILKPYLLTKPDILLVSSAYEEKHFLSAFGVDAGTVYRAFPPRLNLLLNTELPIQNKKNILYVPTWRDDHSFSYIQHIELKSFNDFLQQNSMIFYIKLHPSDKSIENHHHFSNIKVVDQNEDVYEYLKDADVLISDYSSMVFEAFYLSKPVILFCPDYDTYQKNSREFYIDPCDDLPVEVSYRQEELEEKLLHTLENSYIEKEKFKAYKPYKVKNDLLEKLVVKAHS